MKIENIGRFVVQTELAKVEGSIGGGIKYYDVVLCRDNKQVKIFTGCIGEKSAEYWAGVMVKLAKKLDILYTSLENNPDDTEFINEWIQRLITGK